MSRSERSRHSHRSESERDRTVANQPAPAGQMAPDRFEVRCVCGVTLRGRRHPDEPSVICSSCGMELPLDGRSGSPLSARPADLAPAQRREKNIAPKPATVPAAPENRIAATNSDNSAGLIPERLEQRRHVTWLRLLALAVVVLVSATAYWGWHKSRQQRFLVELQNAVRDGETALNEGKFDAAVESLAAADRAARGLNHQNAEARLATQLYHEALIWSKLAVAGVDEFFFAHEAEAAAGDPRLIAEFDRELAGRSILIQTHALRIDPADAPQDPLPAPAAGANVETHAVQAGPKGPPPLALDWLIAGEEFRVEIDPRDLAKIPGVAAVGEQDLVLGAELRALERDSRYAGGSRIRLAPASCVLLTTPGPFAAMNWPEREQLDQLLASQRAAVVPESAKVEPAAEESR